MSINTWEAVNTWEAGATVTAHVVALDVVWTVDSAISYTPPAGVIEHVATGSLLAQDSSVSGTAAVGVNIHDAVGSLTAQDSLISGTALRALNMTELKASLNTSEYGQTLIIDFNQDVSGSTALNFILEPRHGDNIERTASDGVLVGTVDIDVRDESFLANQYVQYTTKEGDIDQVGTWRYKAEVQLNSTVKLVSDYQIVEVLE